MTKKHKNLEMPEVKHCSFSCFRSDFGRPKVVKIVYFLEAWKCWFSIGIYNISKHLGVSESDTKQMQKVRFFMKIQACKKHEKACFLETPRRLFLAKWEAWKVYEVCSWHLGNPLWSPRRSHGWFWVQQSPILEHQGPTLLSFGSILQWCLLNLG